MAKSAVRKDSSAGVPRIALVDANAFFSPRMRDLLMHLGVEGLISVHWTIEIEREWSRNVVAKQGADRTDIQACLLGMRKAAPGWQVQGYEKYEEQFTKVDEKDRHVAAAAHKLSLDEWPGQEVVLVTNNLQDFPEAAFKGANVQVMAPGGFLDALFAEDPKAVLKVVKGCREKLKNPPLDSERYVAVLAVQRAFVTARALAEFWSVECPEIAPDGTLYYASDAPAAKRKRAPARKK